MKKTILSIFFALCCFSLGAQVLNNKMDLFVGTTYVSFHGSEALNEDNFIYPSLFSNYSSQKGVLFKGMYKLGSIICIGVGADFNSSSEWESESFNEYDNSKISLYSVYPAFQLHNRFYETGLLNRFVFNIEITPIIGLSELNLSQSVYDIQNNNGTVSQPMNSKDFYYGLGGSTGMTLSLTNFIGFFVNYSIQYNRIKSPLYVDKEFTTSKVGLGFTFRLKNNKRYYY
jgi:hypothetical protein